MAQQRYSIRAVERASAETATDIRGSLAHALHSPICVSVFLLMRHTLILANVDTIHDLLHDFHGFNFGDSKPSVRFLTLVAHLVTVCILFPCEASQDARTSSY